MFEIPQEITNFDGSQVMTGTGFGDLTVGSFVDIIYVLIFAVLGVLLYIYLISDYSANLSLSGEPRYLPSHQTGNRYR